MLNDSGKHDKKSVSGDYQSSKSSVDDQNLFSTTRKRRKKRGIISNLLRVGTTTLCRTPGILAGIS